MAVLKKFWLIAIFMPWRHSRLYEDLRTRGIGFKTFLLLTVLGLSFSLTSIIQAACGHFPAVPVILPLRLENYFVWQALLVVPWILLTWLLLVPPVRAAAGLAGLAGLNLRQVLVWLGLGFSSCLFWLWVSHFLTAVLYLLGMSQKEWVDLLSQPGWFQTLYLVFMALAVLSGLISLNLSLAGRRKKGKGLLILVASSGFCLWLAALAVFLR